VEVVLFFHLLKLTMLNSWLFGSQHYQLMWLG
jgi:hypothetical protein